MFIENTFTPIPKLTRLYRAWQVRCAMAAMAPYDIAFTFSVDLCLAIGARRRSATPRLVYVGFTQDGPWDQTKIDAISRAMQSYDAITVFTDDERDVYIERYRLDPSRIHTIPIHTDERDGYGAYPVERPIEHDYVLSLGSPNRRFKPVADACRKLGMPLVIVTRPWHSNDSLDELRALGAEVITDANKVRALTLLKHSKMTVMAFDDPAIPGGFTTLVHGMFMRTPFILTQCRGMGEHVVDGTNGFITPHDDQAALEQAMDRLWTEPGLADTFGAQGERLAEQRHSLSAAASHFDALIAGIMSQSAVV
jgi:glycosyltransferase involved in cell wall biosynthesis